MLKMNANEILYLSEFEIKNDLHHIICKEMSSVGISNSVFLVHNVKNKITQIYGWDALSHYIWELMDWNEVKETDIKQINTTIELKLEN
jgi:hypothetical protein